MFESVVLYMLSSCFTPLIAKVPSPLSSIPKHLYFSSETEPAELVYVIEYAAPATGGVYYFLTAGHGSDMWKWEGV